MKPKRFSIPIFMLASFCLLRGEAFSQLNSSVGRVDVYLKTGLVFLQTSKFEEQDYNNATHDYGTSIPFFGIGIETALWEHLLIGGIFGFSKLHSDVKIPNSSEHLVGDIDAYNLFVTAKYCLPIVYKGFSPYIHADAIGLTAYSERRQVTPKTTSSLDEPTTDITENYGIYAGANYPVSERLGVFGELGYGYTLVNLGLTFQIK
ncbi:MAG: hypothetical protein ABI036_12765 [Fibrobacteria bacterium]